MSLIGKRRVLYWLTYASDSDTSIDRAGFLLLHLHLPTVTEPQRRVSVMRLYIYLKLKGV